jgi:rhamnogalacturonyl hydrolase YesR
MPLNVHKNPLAIVARTFKSSRFYNAAAIAEVHREQRTTDERNGTDPLGEALEWLKRAQDATPDRGISRAYGVGWVPYLNSKGWQPSYPETTGYIIPTFFDCARIFSNDELRRRAIEAADWEIEVQMPSGAVMGGTVDQPPTPAVFNTGQVMLGWVRAFEETGNPAYQVALERAAGFLVDNQAPDGGWRKGNSRYAESKTTTYNARVGWALLQAGQALNNDRYLQAGARNMERTISQQTANGWFSENCLDDSARPLTHTISYAIEGLLGGFDSTGEQAYLDAAIKAANPFMRCIREDGWLPGRIDALWNGAVAWSCMTGSAQFAGILLRLHRITDNSAYRASAVRLLDFVAMTQNRVSEDPGLRGGIKGSFPFNGGYGRYEILSWATKFFVDALVQQRGDLVPAVTQFGDSPAQ